MDGIVAFLKDTFFERGPFPDTPPPSVASTATTTAASTRPATPTLEKDRPLLHSNRFSMPGKNSSNGALTAVTTTNIPANPYLWPHDGDLSATTALVIIDMQNDFCSRGGYLDHQGYPLAPMRAPIPHITRLLDAFRRLNWPVFHTREGHRADLSDLSTREVFRSRNNPSGLGIGDHGPMGRLLIRGEKGHDIIPELYPIAGEPVIDKPGRSAFAHTDFELLLRLRSVKKLMVVGVTTDVCVHTTIRDADDRGIECLLVREGCAAAVGELHEAAVEMLTTEGGIFGAVAGIDDVLAALTKVHRREMS